ncbi:hypothetical protein [Streptomyces sp. CB03911]|uniref:hypothetical protein n=1 Tax=Streptomyces sp. CB03911 TaxID=1804758 RepID=UPI002570E5D5|nr:hypothetical protein [Streptomyces sp. CB03911]
MRAGRTDRQGHGAVSTLLVTACPGPPVCSAVHTYLHVDGLDLIGRSHHGATGDHPDRLLRPGGPLHPLDQARTVDVTSQEHGPGAASVRIRVRLRGATVIWGDLMYPGGDGRVVEEVRFDLAGYLAEIERACSRWGRGA